MTSSQNQRYNHGSACFCAVSHANPILRMRYLANEQRDRFDMTGPQELIDGFQLLQPVARILHHPRVARETAGIALGIDHPLDLRARDLGDLRRRSCARRIEHDGLERVELLGQ